MVILATASVLGSTTGWAFDLAETVSSRLLTELSIPFQVYMIFVPFISYVPIEFVLKRMLKGNKKGV